MKNYTKIIAMMALAFTIILSACAPVANETAVTTVPETTPEETTVSTETSVSTLPVAGVDNDEILVYTIDTAIRTDLVAPTVYTATGKTAVWKDASRTEVTSYLTAGNTVTVVAIVGETTRPYALLDSGEYVLLSLLTETAPTETTGPVETTAKGTSDTAKETSPASETTTAWTETPVSKTVYATGSVNIRSGSGTNYGKVRSASFGEALSVVAETSNGWYKLSDGNYISKSVTSDTVPTPKPTQAPVQTAAPTETTAPAAQTTVADRVEAGGTDSIYTGAMEYRASCGFESIPRDATLDSLAQQRAESLAQAGALDHHAGMPSLPGSGGFESLGTGADGNYLYAHGDSSCTGTAIGIGRATHYYADGSTFSVTCILMTY